MITDLCWKTGRQAIARKLKQLELF